MYYDDSSQSYGSHQYNHLTVAPGVDIKQGNMDAFMTVMMDRMAKAHVLYNESNPDNTMPFEEFQKSVLNDMIRGDGTEEASEAMTLERFNEIDSAFGQSMDGMGGSALEKLMRKKGNDWCASCHAVETKEIRFKACAKCKTVKYCSKECQVTHWREHKRDCKRNAAERVKSGVAAPFGGEEVAEMARLGAIPLQNSMTQEKLKSCIEEVQSEARK
jgi:hypothetical protein